MARTSTKIQSQSQNTTKSTGAELSRRRHMAINSLRKRGIEFPEGFENLYTLVSVTESSYFKCGNGTISSAEASEAIDKAVERFREGYDPLNNPNLL